MSDNNFFTKQNIENISERFMHLIQEILCMRKPSEIVLQRALHKIDESKFSFNSDNTLINWAQELIDEEIDHYFSGLIDGIKQDSETCENELFEILQQRFSKVIQKKMERNSAGNQ